MPRIYDVTFSGVAVTAAQDLATALGATGKVLRVLRAWVAATNATPTTQQLQLRCRVFTATASAGSGGSAPTPAKADQGDAAATFTARANDTVKATTSGAAVVVEESGCHVLGGWDNTFVRPPTVAVGQAFVFELLSAPTGTLNLSGGLTIEELG